MANGRLAKNESNVQIFWTKTHSEPKVPYRPHSEATQGPYMISNTVLNYNNTPIHNMVHLKPR
jgi:hypothetical protein